MAEQVVPYEETKLIRVTRGSIYDVIIDLRSDSPTFKQWIGVELTANGYRMLYIPEGFAHGYLTLEENTELTYMVTQFYTPGAESGIRYDDPAFNITWPVPVTVISEKDKNLPDFNEADFLNLNHKKI